MAESKNTKPKVSKSVANTQKAAKEEKAVIEQFDQEKMAELFAKFDKLLKQNEELASKNERLLNENNALRNSSNQIANAPRDIVVGCYHICGINLKDNAGTINIPIRYLEEVSVTIDDLRTVIRSNSSRWKSWFENGLIYFTNDEDYDLFKFNKRFAMDVDHINELLSLPTGDLNNRIREITNRFSNSALVHALFYRIVALTDENKLKNISYENRNFIEKLFSCKISDALASYNTFKEFRDRY